MEEKPASLLFVCGENALRSPMAEAMVKAWYGDAVYVDSVGMRAGELNQFAVVVMNEIGIDISKHGAKGLDGLRDTAYDLIIALSDEAYKEALKICQASAVNVLRWPLLDPSRIEGNRETRLAAFRQVRDTLRCLIEEKLGPVDRQNGGRKEE